MKRKKILKTKGTMDEISMQMELRENKARIEMLEATINALLAVLHKEGITTKEEVDNLTKDLIQKKGKDE